MSQIYPYYLRTLRANELNSAETGQELTSSNDPMTPLKNFFLSDTTTPIPHPSPEPIATPAVLVGAGDISICGRDGDNLTADLLDDIPGVIFTLGDNSNEQGTMEQYQECYDPTWGRYLQRIRPSPGNHDYVTDDAEDYYEYFGDAAGEPGKGYYSYDVGGWHVISLNSNCAQTEDCEESSRQIDWLVEDLEQHPNLCTLAYWHHPRWESDDEGDRDFLDTFWQVLYDHDVELVVNGHEHYYERLAPQNPDGDFDMDKGIRQFTVGTGGAGLRDYDENSDSSLVQVRSNENFGVLKLNLFPDYYEWDFIPVGGDGFADSGFDVCH